jgi:hypothetical protein
MSPQTRAVTTPAEAQAALERMSGVIERLREVIERETMLVQKGELANAAALTAAKAELAGELFAGGELLKANAKFLLQAAPVGCTTLKHAEEAFRAVLQKNMIVIATAHAVSEGIVRRLSGDLARTRSPQVYGATGRTSAPQPKHGQPLAVSRVL